MPAFVIISAAAVAVSLCLLVWSVTAARAVRQATTRNLARGPVRSDLRVLVLERSAHERTLRPVVARISELGGRLVAASGQQRLERLLVLAGTADARAVERVLALKVVLATGGVALGLLLLLEEPSPTGLAVSLGVVGSGWLAPDALVRARARKRQRDIQLALPDTLDQITVCVEAGDGFESALHRISRAGSGPLSHELRRTLQEMQVGSTRSQALRALAERTEGAELSRFVTAMLQAESYGIPIARILRSQATEMRVRRRQRAEEHALKIPVKLVFPLITCILPSLFIVILGPAAIRLIRFFGGTGTL